MVGLYERGTMETGLISFFLILFKLFLVFVSNRLHINKHSFLLLIFLKLLLSFREKEGEKFDLPTLRLRQRPGQVPEPNLMISEPI